MLLQLTDFFQIFDMYDIFASQHLIVEYIHLFKRMLPFFIIRYSRGNENREKLDFDTARLQPFIVRVTFIRIQKLHGFLFIHEAECIPPAHLEFQQCITMRIDYSQLFLLLLYPIIQTISYATKIRISYASLKKY